jgi:SAM-dependent methyltransferase
MVNKKVDFDEHTEKYNQHLNDGTSFFVSNEAYFAQYKIDILRTEIYRPVRRVLEFGCGIGRNIPFLRRAYPNAVIVGSDISNASLDIARQQNVGVEFVEESEATKFNDKFDLVFVAGVFHHVPLPLRSQVANSLLARMTPDGDLFVFEHNPFNPVTRRIVNNCPYDADAVLLKPRELANILTHAAFVIKKSSYCLVFPPSLSLLAPLEPRLGWLPIGGQYWIHARL